MAYLERSVSCGIPGSILTSLTKTQVFNAQRLGALEVLQLPTLQSERDR